MSEVLLGSNLGAIKRVNNYESSTSALALVPAVDKSVVAGFSERLNIAPELRLLVTAGLSYVNRAFDILITDLEQHGEVDEALLDRLTNSHLLTRDSYPASIVRRSNGVDKRQALSNVLNSGQSILGVAHAATCFIHAEGVEKSEKTIEGIPVTLYSLEIPEGVLTEGIRNPRTVTSVELQLRHPSTGVQSDNLSVLRRYNSDEITGAATEITLFHDEKDIPCIGFGGFETIYFQEHPFTQAINQIHKRGGLTDIIYVLRKVA